MKAEETSESLRWPTLIYTFSRIIIKGSQPSFFHGILMQSLPTWPARKTKSWHQIPRVGQVSFSLDISKIWPTALNYKVIESHDIHFSSFSALHLILLVKHGLIENDWSKISNLYCMLFVITWVELKIRFNRKC